MLKLKNNEIINKKAMKYTSWFFYVKLLINFIFISLLSLKIIKPKL